jgi:uncharacterized protein YbaR (Trm112 family)
VPPILWKAKGWSAGDRGAVQSQNGVIGMVDQSLLDILVCPETKQPLRLADGGLLDRLNASVRKGAVTNKGGAVVTDDILEGLVREDGACLYPIRDDIPIMLIDESIPLSEQA